MAQVVHMDREPFHPEGWTDEEVEEGKKRMLEQLERLKQRVEAGSVVGIFGIALGSTFDTTLIDVARAGLYRLIVVGAIHRAHRDLLARRED